MERDASLSFAPAELSIAGKADVYIASVLSEANFNLCLHFTIIFPFL